MTTSKALVDDFLSQKNLAIVGASAKKNKFGNAILRELKARGYRAIPVHPGAAEIEGEKCYPALTDLPEEVGGVVICVSPKNTLKVLEDASEAGVKRIWIQQGAQSREAIAFCNEKGLEVIHGECLLMFLKPAALPHRVHRWLRGLTGKLPR